MLTEKYHYLCNDCHAEYAADGILYLCPACSGGNVAGQPPKGVLKTVYDYDKIKRGHSSAALFSRLESEGFLPLLPLQSMESWPKLRIGDTPLYQVNKLTSERVNGLAGRMDFEVYLKDDSQNPTFSFKDRASALVSAWAKEQGIRTLIAASTGNAGSSLAGICAAQGQQSVIFVPAAAPLAKLTQILMYGARIVPVNGNYDQAFALSVKATEMFGFYNRNTAFNPFTIEGKKTVVFELFAQLDEQVPDRIFVPTGDGVILAGVYKGFEDLMELGITDHMPVIVAVQSAGSDNLVRNIGVERFSTVPSKTIADSISVDVPQNFCMSVSYLTKYAGEWITVTDEEIIAASVKLSRSTGIFSEPAAVAAYAGMENYARDNRLQSGSKNVVMLTGSGLKDLKSVQSLITMPLPVDPDPHSLELIFRDTPLHS